jgi:hypothetical protein
MRPNASVVISATAFVVAVFGSTPIGKAAWSQVVPPNSVGTPQLKKSAVTTPKLARDAVNSARVLDGSLLAADFKAGQLFEAVSAADRAPVVPPPVNPINQWVLVSPGFISDFTTSRAGQLLLLKDITGFMDCPVSSAAWFWLTLDGAPVRSSFRVAPAEGPPFLALSFNGVTAQAVPAGQHALGVEAMCTTGNPIGTGNGQTYSGGSVVVLP